MMIKNSVYGLVLLLIFILNSCNDPITNTKKIDVSFFVDPTCIESCWRGLRPGITTGIELREFLSINGFTNIRFDGAFNDGYSMFFASRNNRDYSVSFILKNDIISNIEIVNSSPLDLPLSEIIDNLGEPEYVQYNYSFGIPNLRDGANINIYYPSKGYWFIIEALQTVREEKGALICITMEKNARSVYLTSKITIEKMIGESRFPLLPKISPTDVQILVSRLTSWEGFTCKVFHDSN